MKKVKEKETLCEICGNPIAPGSIKCKWCKKTLRPEYYIKQQKERKKENMENVTETK